MFKLNEEKMFYDIAEGQAIIINFTTGMYYGTSSLGSAVVDALLGGASVDAVLAAVKKLPGCPENIDASMGAFVDALLEKEVLVSGETNPDAVIAIDESALTDGFLLSVDEFTEVQDLIMADPVHDVDVEQGWPILGE